MNLCVKCCRLVTNLACFLVGVLVTNIVQWQPPDGSRFASGFVLGTAIKYFISYNSRG